MIDAWHLVWIVPVAAALGYIAGALLTAAGIYDGLNSAPHQPDNKDT